MERIIDDEKTRRKVEQIYARKNGINIENNKKKYFSIYKFLFQLLILINLAICVIFVKNRNFIFSTEFLNKVSEFYNINITEKFENFFMQEEVEIQVPNQNIQDTNITQNVQNTENIIQEQNVEVQSQVEKSTENIIKESYSFIKPIEGTITSFFGERELSNEKKITNHTGIDISAVEGTIIKSAIEGTVTQVSNKGNYGNHVKIEQKEIITLYAHCKTINVKEGEKIFQGQDIAEVGSTGKSTGPHLHFEIRYNNEYIDPCQILEY